MNIIKAHNLTCPIDGARLEQKDGQLICENGHSFDIARQGYVNLLPVQHKRSKQPGDSKAMVLARTEVLNSGIYEPVASKLIEIVSEQMASDDKTCILDAGCGEGYYLEMIFNALSDNHDSLSFIGLDISKDAIIQSTKRNKQISWLVGTNRQPPVKDESIDIILCLFGFICSNAFSKALKPGGKVILVDPGREHLKELRKIIYPELKKTDQSNALQDATEGFWFSLLKTEELTFKVKLSSNERIKQLLIMTPHFYRASKEGRQAASCLTELEITIDVVFRVLEKA